MLARVGENGFPILHPSTCFTVRLIVKTEHSSSSDFPGDAERLLLKQCEEVWVSCIFGPRGGLWFHLKVFQ